MTIFDTEIAKLDGSPNALADLSGNVVLLVNVASACGLTPQYTQLEELQKRYEGQGFSVLGVPCNQFGAQEPGSPEEIQTFCSTTYGVTFPLTEKIEVNGPGRHQLYEQLVTIPDADGRDGDIQWNFEKFLIGSGGDVVARFAPTVTPDDATVVSAIESQLS